MALSNEVSKSINCKTANLSRLYEVRDVVAIAWKLANLDIALEKHLIYVREGRVSAKRRKLYFRGT